MTKKILKPVAKLEQNYPNPFRKQTTIFYTVTLPQTCKISLKISDEKSDNEIKTLVNKRQKRGRYEVQWDGTNEKGEKVPRGTYICRLIINNFMQIRKMVLSE
ncbi:MAG: hypothetical protein A2145_07205 [candidate division Zixibacteria bacterium RBG_16_40_9]|nr:MAG: hypothetical protein A2145_07205 [candidate division Zixibacteria bacterium RBG_16_40_9]